MTPSHIDILVHQRLEFGMQHEKAMNQSDLTFPMFFQRESWGICLDFKNLDAVVLGTFKMSILCR